MQEKIRYSKRYIITVVAIILIIATAILRIDHQENYLVICDGETKEDIAEFMFGETREFAVKFRHSVNQSMVEDRYRIQDDAIMVYETVYYNFGAGVQTQLGEGQTLTEGKDGSMIIGDIDTVIPELYYNISPVYDHILEINDTEVSLKELCYDSRTVLLQYEVK